MKLLDSSSLNELSSSLSLKSGEHNVSCTLENYSCKMTGEDKRLFKAFTDNGGPKELARLAPPQTVYSCSPAQTLSTSCSSVDDEPSFKYVCDRKTIYNLISTLNASFDPEYDFMDTQSIDFSREPSVDFIQSYINSHLSSAVGDKFDELSQNLWTTINQEISLEGCDVYSYKPDLSSDPFGDEGCLWSFCFFFYNYQLKRILLFTCVVKSFATANFEEDEYEEDLQTLDDNFHDNISLMI